MYGLVKKIAQIVEPKAEVEFEDTIPINSEIEGFIFINGKEIPSVINIIPNSKIEISYSKEYKPEISLSGIVSRVILVDTSYHNRQQRAVFFDANCPPCLVVGEDTLDMEDIMDFCSGSDLVFSTKKGVYSMSIMDIVQEEVR